MKKRTETYETIKISDKDSFAVNFLYNSLPGRLLLSLFVRPTVSKIFGFLMDSLPSRWFIHVFIERNNIHMDEYKNVKYKSFNDFFTREIKRELRSFPANEYDLAAPSDGKLTAYRITENSIFHIKNSAYSVNSLLRDDELAKEFMNGVCLIFRLEPDDYHRYNYIDDGEILSCQKINGVLHTVRPISQQRYKIYTENAREYTVIQTKNFGKVIQMEVGALLVGRIVNKNIGRTVKRGNEKGMFEFGGSTIVMLFQNNSVRLDDAIYKNTKEDKETIVKMGYKIGEKRCIKGKNNNE